MKTTRMILIATWCATIASGQVKYKATNAIILYNKPDYNSLIRYIYTGTFFDLSTKTGEFWEVTYREKLRYMPDICRRDS